MCQCTECKTMYDPNDNYACPVCGNMHTYGQKPPKDKK